MDDLLRLLLTNAGSAFLIALLAWAASLTIRRQAVVHGLWLLALVRLVTPPIAPVPLVPDWPGLARVSPASTPTVVSMPPGAPGETLDRPAAVATRPRCAFPPPSRSALSPHRRRARSPAPTAFHRAVLAGRRVAVARGRRPRHHAAHGLAVRAVRPPARLRPARARRDRGASGRPRRPAGAAPRPAGPPGAGPHPADALAASLRAAPPAARGPSPRPARRRARHAPRARARPRPPPRPLGAPRRDRRHRPLLVVPGDLVGARALRRAEERCCDEWVLRLCRAPPRPTRTASSRA